MSLQSLAQPKGTGLRSLAGLASKPVKKTSTSSFDSEDLTQKAQEVGLGKEATKITTAKPKLTFLQRLGTVSDVLNPAEAILTGKEKGVGAGIAKYATGIVKGIGSAITGKDYVGKKRHFSDVAEELGVENKIAKAGIGFIGDVLLDPSTYFGGAIAKGISKGLGATTKLGLKGIEKVAPETATGLKMAGTGLQDALGRAFKYGYKASKGATGDITSFLSKEQQAKLGLASSNLNRLGTGILSKEQSEELAMKLVEGKRGEFLARSSGTAKPLVESSDPLVQKTIEAQKARTSKFAKQLNLENPYETYFPFIKKDKLDGFIKQVGSSKIKVGSEAYRKEFRNLLTNDALELDPAKAFFTSEAQQVTDRMTRDFLQGFTKKYGKDLTAFKNVDEAKNAGYELIKEKGIFGKELGYVPKWDAKLIKDSLDPGFQTINMLAKATGFDAVTSLFKRSVTGLFAPFHVRNFVSGQIQNFEALGIDALNPKNIAVGQKIAYLMGKGKKLPAELEKTFKPFVDRFSGDTFYNADFENALKSGHELKAVAKTFSKERLKTTAKTLGLGQEAIPFKLGRTVGQFIEHQQKATAYITALGKGKSVTDALALAEKAGFDYRALTGFESQIMRRIIPFYSFTRKNLELQLKTLGENPQRINQIMKFFGNVSGIGGLTDEEKAKLPDYLQEQFTMSFGKNKAGNPIVSGSFGTPIEQPGGAVFGRNFGESVRKVASTLNPLIKTPLEKAFGKDFFFNRPIKEIVDAKQYQILPDYLKKFIAFKEVPKKDKNGKEYVTYTADPEKLHILRNLPTTRLFGYLYEIYRPEEDTVKGAKTLNLLTGVKPKPIDIETVEYFRNRDKQRELEDLLIRAGVLKEFKKIYEPSKKTKSPLQKSRKSL